MYKIIIDSCGELPEDLKKDDAFVRVPLTLSLEGWEAQDDEDFDRDDFLRRMKASDTIPKSACPSPAAYMQEIEDTDAKNVYMITLSAQLSGSYNAAVLGKELYEEDHEDDDEQKNIHVFDSKSASIGQTLIGMKIAELEKKGLAFDEIVRLTDEYIASQHTFFVLESLEALRKAGRLGSLKAMIANTLNIKPVMGSTDEGNIQQLASARGMMKSMEKMVDCMLEVTENMSEKILAISHCNAPAAVEHLVSYIKKVADFKDIFVLDTAGVSTLYAGPGGVIMVV